VNDLLFLAQRIQSIRLFDFAFVAVAVGLSWMLARRYNRLTVHLQQEVDARTAQPAVGRDVQSRHLPRVPHEARMRAGRMSSHRGPLRTSAPAPLHVS
jgi:hypothetical protein